MTQVGLNNALSGLRTTQSQIANISSNVANATTPGYTRKTLPQETIVSEAGAGLGVRISTIIRKVDVALLEDLFQQTSVVEAATVREDYLGRIQRFHGASELNISVSAELTELNQSFTKLSAAPDDRGLLAGTVSQAQVTANKFNDLANLITDLRNSAQADLEAAITELNAALLQVEQLNNEIGALSSADRSIAALEDQRDEALNIVSKHIQIRTFEIEDDRIVILDNEGNTILDDNAREILYNPIPISAESSLGNGEVARVTIRGVGNLPDIDITEQDIGGDIQALLDLRDETLLQYQAQLDELAQKMAERFQQQGLTLFVDQSGNVPASTTPPVPTTYTGFASQMRVNQAIIDDPTLLRNGTDGNVVLSGSTEVIDRILQFTFGSGQFDEANGTLDISAGVIQIVAGLQQQGRVIGITDITAFDPLDSNPNIAAGSQFDLDLGAGPFTVTINAGDTAANLVTNINALAGGTGSARLNGLGQLVLEANSDITITDVSLGGAGFNELGISPGVIAAENPSFQVQIGQQVPFEVEIEPADTQVELLSKLNAIPGVTASLDGGTGGLIIQAIDSNGRSSGELTLIDGLGAPIQALGVTVSSVLHEPFRTTELGLDANVESGITAASSLEEYARSIIAFQADEHAQTIRQLEDENAFFTVLNERFINETGVNLDEELADLIRFQTTYSALSNVIRSIDEQFDELINAFR